MLISICPSGKTFYLNCGVVKSGFVIVSEIKNCINCTQQFPVSQPVVYFDISFTQKM